MRRDLTSSQIDRQNILNNKQALSEIQRQTQFQGIIFEDKLCFTKTMVATYFDVEIRTVERYVSEYQLEFEANGYEILKGKRLKDFLQCIDDQDVPDINVGNISNKTPQLAIFDFRTFLNLSMVMVESPAARTLRQIMLDIAIDTINQKAGGSTKYINQRDQDFIGAFLQEENYRREFTDALHDYVSMGNAKYGIYTDKIYQSIFKEKAAEYRQILKLSARERIRDTFYSEVLTLISSYECGLAEMIKTQSEQLGRPLNNWEVSDLFEAFERLPLWKPLIVSARTKMASRDMALRDAFHFQLEEYIKPLETEEYEKFLGEAGDELEKLMEEHQDVLFRLKESE
ncbi:MAG: DNA-binding protein [Lachnospiraceae bacterium]|nr:DNA-binding protein [Lachnospiraceae bacterium]MBD5506410.1 DNA-binding protein [Lachnospiraceae bacterium]